MIDQPRARCAATVASRVRESAFGAAIAAALLIYFGFINPRIAWEGTGLVERGSQLFVLTIQVGACLMGTAALLLYLGILHAMLLDGLSSLGVGIGFAVSASMTWVGGDGLPILNYVFAIMFVVAGMRNVKEWRTLFASVSNAMTSDVQSVEAARNERDLPIETLSVPRLDTAAKPIPSVPKTELPKPDLESVEPTPDGYLASFAEPQKDDDNA